jgi:predicted ArsR family transcriptional regulator
MVYSKKARKKVKSLDIYDRKVWRTLLTNNRPMNANSVSKKVGISWNTARSKLNKLNKNGYISSSRTKSGIRTYSKKKYKKKR